MSEIEVPEGCRVILLSKGQCAIVDEADYDKVAGISWYACWNRYTWYAKHSVVTGSAILGNRKWSAIFMHRLIVNAPDEMDADHIDGNGLNNRRSNLRIATRHQNGGNRRRTSGASRYKGVARAAKKWQANIRVDGKLIYLGVFWTQEDAARAYDQAALKHFGEFAATNVDIFGEY